jgi:hypothetical protein
MFCMGKQIRSVGCTCDAQGALLDATALAGKRSLRLTAVLKLMRPA